MLDYRGNLMETRVRKDNQVISTVITGTANESRQMVSCVIDRSTDTVLLADDLTARRYCSNVPSDTFEE